MQKKTHKKKVIILIVTIVLLICTITGGIVLAKYISDEKKSTGLVTTKNFYFTSNLLDGKEYTFAPGTTSVTFTLGNYADDLRYSEIDITYTVTVDNANATISNSTGTLAKGSVKDVEVTIGNLQAGTYTITAVGIGGYQKTLQATIKILDKTPKLYYNIDSSNTEYIFLTVWNEGDGLGTTTITYTGIPDNTNPNMTDWTITETSKIVTIGPHESKVFRFFGGTVTVTGAEQKGLN